MRRWWTARGVTSSPEPPRQRGALVRWAVLGVALLAGCSWRLACVRVGPDPDTDAYGHFLIARLLLETPLNFKIHWVWLPLYHAALSLPVALGASLDAVRSLNAVGAALPPLSIFWALSPRSRAPGLLDAELPLLAALLAAAAPLSMQLGTTGQMEVFFCSLLMLAVALLARGHAGWAAVPLCALVLTRYEGWVVAAVVAVVLLAQCHSRRARPGTGELACVLLPALCVFAWASLRRFGGEPWFGFIIDNQLFAERALEQGRDAPGAFAELSALGRYTVVVPYRTFGLSAVLALLGVRRALRHDGIWFVAPGFGILGFLTLSSLSRSQLGLERHFLSVVPFAAVWIAHGMAETAGIFARAGQRLWPGASTRSSGPGAPRSTPSFGASQSAALLLGAAVSLGAALRLQEQLSLWWNTTRIALAQPREVARFLQTTPDTALIVCDDASVEILSGLDSSRFVRAHPDASTAERVNQWSRGRDVYVVSRARNLGAFLHAGPVSYGALDGPPDAFVAILVPAAETRDEARVDG